jgi:bifunctional enzyme CysN/CysC
VGDAVTIRIDDNLDVSRGAMFSSASDKPATEHSFDATVCWMTERASLRPGMMLRIKHTTHTARAMVSGLECKIDINSLSTLGSCEELKLNEIGQLTLRTSEPLVFDKYADARGTGSFILIDESTNETVGAGMIGRPPYLAPVGG